MRRRASPFWFRKRPRRAAWCVALLVAALGTSGALPRPAPAEQAQGTATCFAAASAQDAQCPAGEVTSWRVDAPDAVVASDRTASPATARAAGRTEQRDLPGLLAAWARYHSLRRELRFGALPVCSRLVADRPPLSCAPSQGPPQQA